MDSFINALPNLTSGDLKVLAGLLGTSSVVAVLLQTVKHKLNLQEAKKTVTALLGVFTLLASLADWYITSSNQSPAHFTGKYAGWILAGAVFVHQLVGNPIYKKIVAALETYSAGKTLIQVPEDKLAPGTTVSTPIETNTTASTEPHEFTLGE